MSNVINHILARSVAGPFYRKNAGLFLFLFFLLFGTQPSLGQALQFHYAIIQAILTNISFFLLACLVWLVYTLRVILFLRETLAKNIFGYLRTLESVPHLKRSLHLLWLQVTLLAPVLVYALIVMIIGASGKYWAGTLATLTVIFLLLGTCSWAAGKLLLSGGDVFRFPIKLHSRLPNNLIVFLWRFMMREQFLGLFALKLISFLCLYGLASLDSSLFEGRLLWLIFLTLLAGHAILIYRNQQFMETRLAFLRNLPLPRMQVLVSLLVVYTVLLLPEAWAMKNVLLVQGQGWNYIWLILAGPFILLLLHCLLYSDDMSIEAYLQLTFGVWIVLLFCSLSENRWLIPLSCASLSTFIFLNSYYRYEKKMAIEKLE